MSRIIVLDTNVLLHNPNALFDFPGDEIVLPFVVIEELDDKKKRLDEIGRNARMVSRFLYEMRNGGSLQSGVKIKGGGSIRIETNNLNSREMPKYLNLYKPDNIILALAFALKKKNGGKKEIILVSKDLNVCIKADVIGVTASDYERDKVNYDELYSGYVNYELGNEELEQLEKEKAIIPSEGANFLQNQFIVCNTGGKEPLILRFKDGFLLPLKYGNLENWGIKPLNAEQKMAHELLLDDSVKVVSLVGIAGTGKTLISLAAGMEKVINDGIKKTSYRKLVIARPVVPSGPDIGYLPGSKEEKMEPWMQAIYDNLSFIVGNDQNDYLNMLKEKGIIEVGIVTYIRGRTLPNLFIVCDEAQNFTPKLMKTIITRVGEGTKIVITGDPEQIDNPFLDANSNGLSYLVERLKGQDFFGHVTLRKGERSKVAEICSQRL